VSTFVTMTVLVLVVAVLFWLLKRDNHACTPDGSRFTCDVQEVATASDPLGDRRWFPARAVVEGRKVIVVRIGIGEASDSRWYTMSRSVVQKVTGTRGGTGPLRPFSYEVRAEAAHPPRGQAVFLLDEHLAVRIPARSPAVAVLRGLLAQPRA
jgi:hypothetical protein